MPPETEKRRPAEPPSAVPRRRNIHPESSALRKLGYRVQWRPDPLLGRLAAAGLRVTPLDRTGRGTYFYTVCPSCEGELWLDRHAHRWDCLGCGAGGDEIDLALLLRGVA